MADTVGAKRRWVVDILTKVSIIVNQNAARIIISSVFSGGAEGRLHGQSLTMSTVLPSRPQAPTPPPRQSRHVFHSRITVANRNHLRLSHREGLSDRPPHLPQMRRHDAHHCLHRQPAGHREDPAPPRALESSRAPAAPSFQDAGAGCGFSCPGGHGVVGLFIYVEFRKPAPLEFNRYADKHELFITYAQEFARLNKAKVEEGDDFYHTTRRW